MMEWDNIYKKCFEKVAHTERSLNGGFPHTTKNGVWQTTAHGHWTGGFWTGLLWLKAIYPHQQESELQNALTQAKLLSARLEDNKTHDMGFIFGPSCIMGNRIRHNDELIKMAIAGANNLKHLYDKEAGILYAWDEPGYEGATIVDTIMNVPLLLWAAKQRDDHELFDMGITLADHIGMNHLRKDYSTYHLLRWDVSTHQVIERSTHQGYSADSCWSRGQAWALYGFANMHRYTQKGLYLEYAIKLADYFWQNLDTDILLPRWDFIFKNHTEEPLDAAAAGIAASGMLLLSKLLQANDKSNSILWQNRAVKILESLVKNCLFTELNQYGIIRHVTVDKPRNSGVDESSAYGDYYFMEAIFRLMNYNDDLLPDILY